MIQKVTFGSLPKEKFCGTLYRVVIVSEVGPIHM